MNQDPDEYSVNNPPAGPSFDPAFPVQPPTRTAGPPYQQQQSVPPGPDAREELQARLRALREQRQQADQGHVPPSIEFQRRGLPSPPTPQPPLKDVLKHWWEHGPFSGSLPGADAAEGQGESQRAALRRSGRPTGPLSPSGPLSPYQPDARGKTGALPRRGGPTQPLDERAKELLNQGRETLSSLNTHAQTMVSQAKDWLNERARQHLEQVAQREQQARQSSLMSPQLPSVSQPLPMSQPPLAPQPPSSQPLPAPQPLLVSQPELAPEGIVPGLVVIGFDPRVSREEGIQRIAALGGKPLRYKASLNLFQVAVPPGQERAMIQRFWQQPEVVSAGIERARPQQ